MIPDYKYDEFLLFVHTIYRKHCTSKAPGLRGPAGGPCDIAYTNEKNQDIHVQIYFS